MDSSDEETKREKGGQLASWSQGWPSLPEKVTKAVKAAIASGAESDASCASLDRHVGRPIKVSKKRNRPQPLSVRPVDDSGSEDSQNSVKKAPMRNADLNSGADKPNIAALFKTSYKKMKLSVRDEVNPVFTHPGSARPNKKIVGKKATTTETSNRFEGEARVEEDMEVVPPQPQPEPQPQTSRDGEKNEKPGGGNRRRLSSTAK